MTDLLPDEIIVCDAAVSMSNRCEVRMCISGDIGELTGKHTRYIRADLVSTLTKPAEVDLNAIRADIWPSNIDEYLNGIRCGVEDRDLQNDAYGAAEWAYQEGLEYALSCLPEGHLATGMGGDLKRMQRALIECTSHANLVLHSPRNDDGTHWINGGMSSVDEIFEKILSACYEALTEQQKTVEPCGDVQAALDAKIKRYEDALHYLIERADDSNDARYGTLSASFVRDVCSKALEGKE